MYLYYSPYKGIILYCMDAKTLKISFAWQPLLLLLLPISLIVFPFCPLFRGESLAFVAIIEGEGGILGDAVSGYAALGYSGAPLGLYWTGVSCSLALAIFGIASSFLPNLRGFKTFSIALFSGSSLTVLFNILALTLLAAHVDETSKRWLYDIEKRDVTFVSAYGYANLFFYLLMFLPIAVLCWWIGSYVNLRRSMK